MREIKFKAWDKENKKIIDCTMKNMYISSKGYICWWTMDYDYGYYRLNLPDWIPLFYTGFKDKNGKEIYEGDIVRYCQKSYHMNADGFGRHLDIDMSNSFSTNIRTAVVTYRPERAEYRMVDIGSSNSRNLYELPLEVIGNKFENQELLVIYTSCLWK